MSKRRREDAPRDRKRPYAAPRPPCTPEPPRAPEPPRPPDPGCATGPDPLPLLKKVLRKKR